MKALRFLVLSSSLTLVTAFSFAASVQTLEIHSRAMDRVLHAAVVLPESYASSEKPFPVLYLLHGGTGGYEDWLTKTPDKKLLHGLADQYNLIIVTPDGDPLSYYFDSPLAANSQFETFITREVVERIDGAFRTIADRKGRVIAGLSMGGHGAMFLSTRHPELYVAAGSMSGVMNLDTSTWKVAPEFAKLRAEYFAGLLGPAQEGDNPHPGYSVVSLADRMKDNKVALIFDCGVDDFLVETNRELHRRLLANRTPHDYIERPGGHTWDYWENALAYQVLFFSKILKANGTLIP